MEIVKHLALGDREVRPGEFGFNGFALTIRDERPFLEIPEHVAVGLPGGKITAVRILASKLVHPFLKASRTNREFHLGSKLEVASLELCRSSLVGISARFRAAIIGFRNEWIAVH